MSSLVSEAPTQRHPKPIGFRDILNRSVVYSACPKRVGSRCVHHVAVCYAVSAQIVLSTLSSGPFDFTQRGDFVAIDRRSWQFKGGYKADIVC